MRSTEVRRSLESCCSGGRCTRSFLLASCEISMQRDDCEWTRLMEQRTQWWQTEDIEEIMGFYCWKISQFTFFRCNTLTTNFCGKYCIVYLTNPPKCNATKKQRSLKSPQHEWFVPCLPCCMNHLNGPQIDLEILWRGSIPRLGDSGLSYWTVIYTSNSYAFTHILLLRVLYFHWGRCFILMFIGT